MLFSPPLGSSEAAAVVKASLALEAELCVFFSLMLKGCGLWPVASGKWPVACGLWPVAAGTEAKRHRGLEAQRHRGTEAERHRGQRSAVSLMQINANKCKC